MGFGAPLHLELTLKDSRRAFMPLTPVRVPPRLAVLRQFSSIDPERWGIAEIVDRQIVPFLCASERTSPWIGATVDAGPFEQAGGPPIIIAAEDSEDGDIAPILGLLALDPETRLAPIALVLPAERFRRQASRIKEIAQFYRLSLKLMAAEESGDLYDLLEAGSGHCRMRRWCCLPARCCRSEPAGTASSSPPVMRREASYPPRLPTRTIQSAGPEAGRPGNPNIRRRAAMPATL